MARARLPRSARPSGVPRSISASTGHAAADATDPPAFIREANGTEGQVERGPECQCAARGETARLRYAERGRNDDKKEPHRRRGG